MKDGHTNLGSRFLWYERGDQHAPMVSMRRLVMGYREYPTIQVSIHGPDPNRHHLSTEQVTVNVGIIKDLGSSGLRFGGEKRECI